MRNIAADLKRMAGSHPGRLLIRSFAEGLVLCVLLAAVIYRLHPLMQCAVYGSYLVGALFLLRYLVSGKWVTPGEGDRHSNM